jgi:DNA gyrase subunit A
MSVIVARALPDVRDGFKPVQRRILYAMHDMGLRSDRPYKKSARIVGEVLGKYHPHGDSAVYEAMARMAQDFSCAIPWSTARATSAPSTATTRRHALHRGAPGAPSPNDAGRHRPKTRSIGRRQLRRHAPGADDAAGALLPNLLINGSSGIAVGMATNIPPHNLAEVVRRDRLSHRSLPADLDKIALDELMQFIQGPDFPTGGIILGSEGIRKAYATGNGRIVVRANAHDRGDEGAAIASSFTPSPSAQQDQPDRTHRRAGARRPPRYDRGPAR